MAVPSEQSTIACTNCDKTIPAPNIELHLAHCIRNLERCKSCGEMVPKRHADRHYLDGHALVACELCNEMVERGNVALHKFVNCPFRIVVCEYCNMRLPAVDLIEHYEACGNQIKGCHECRRHITGHGNRWCLGISNARNLNSTRRDKRSQRRESMHAWSKRGVLFAVAIAGIAVLSCVSYLPKKG